MAVSFEPFYVKEEEDILINSEEDFVNYASLKLREFLQSKGVNFKKADISKDELEENVRDLLLDIDEYIESEGSVYFISESNFKEMIEEFATEEYEDEFDKNSDSYDEDNYDEDYDDYSSSKYRSSDYDDYEGRMSDY